MKIALYKILKFPTFLTEASDKKLSTQTNYKIFILRQSIENHIKFYNENLQKIISSYALYDENGQFQKNAENGILISKDSIEECSQKIQELNNCLIELPEIYFSLIEFEEVKFTLEGFEAIFPFIKEE